MYNVYCILTSWPPQEKLFFGPFFFNITNVFCAKKWVGMLVYAPGWSLASQFWSYTPPKKLVFPRPKNENSPLKTVFLIQISFWKFWRFTVCAAKILSRRSRLSRWSRAPSRLIRPRPIDWDFGPKQRVKIFPGFGFELCQKKGFLKGPRSNPDLHPKRCP